MVTLSPRPWRLRRKTAQVRRGPPASAKRKQLVPRNRGGHRRGDRFGRDWKKRPCRRPRDPSSSPLLPRDADEQQPTSPPHISLPWRKTGPEFSSDAAGDGPPGDESDEDLGVAPTLEVEYDSEDEDYEGQFAGIPACRSQPDTLSRGATGTGVLAGGPVTIHCRVPGCSWHAKTANAKSGDQTKLIGDHIRAASSRGGHGSAAGTERHYVGFARCQTCGHLYKSAGLATHSKKCTTAPISGWRAGVGFSRVTFDGDEGNDSGSHSSSSSGSRGGGGNRGGGRNSRLRLRSALASGPAAHQGGTSASEGEAAGDADGNDSREEADPPSWRDLFSRGSLRPITTVHARLRPAFRDATLALIQDISKAMEDKDIDKANAATRALYGLPGLALDSKGRFLRVCECKNDFLEISTAADPTEAATLCLDKQARSFPPLHLASRDTDTVETPSLETRRQRALLRAEELAEACQLGRALRTLENFSGPPPLGKHAYHSTEMQEALADLHPAASDRDRLPAHDPTQDGPPMRVQSMHVYKALQSSARKSAGGMSHWTLDLIRLITTRNLETQITRLFNLLLAGQGGAPELWTLSRLVPIPKPAGGGAPHRSWRSLVTPARAHGRVVGQPGRRG